MQPMSKIFSDVSKSVGSSGLQFLITLVTTPLMTRLYAPESYAAFGILFTMATLTVGIGLCSLPNAYPMEKDEPARAALMRAMLLLLGLLVVLAALAALVMGLEQRQNLNPSALVFLPVLVLTFGIRQLLVTEATAHAKFGALALGQGVEPIVARGGSLALGATLGGLPAYMLLSVAAGHVITAVIIGKRTFGAGWRKLIAPTVNLREVFRRHREFILFHTLAQQAQPLATLGTQMAIAALFSAHMAGQYMLALSILTMPISLVALTTSQVFYRHIIDVAHHMPAALLRHQSRAMLMYLAGAIILYLPVLFFGETLFAFIFGAAWRKAGHIACVLSIPCMLVFVLTGVQSVFRVAHRLKLQFWMESSLSLLTLAGAIICFKTLPFDTAIVWLAGIWCVRYGIMLAACLAAARRHSHPAEAK